MRMIRTSAIGGAAMLALAACSQEPAPPQDATEDAMVGDPAVGDGATGAATTRSQVAITVDGVEAGGGQLFVALQNADQFLAADGAYKTRVDATGATVTAMFDGVAPGTYAAAVIHDQNGDGQVELGARGPTEAWGLSGSAQSGKPEWMPATFTVSDAGGQATVTLKYPD